MGVGISDLNLELFAVVRLDGEVVEGPDDFFASFASIEAVRVSATTSSRFIEWISPSEANTTTVAILIPQNTS